MLWAKKNETNSKSKGLTARPPEVASIDFPGITLDFKRDAEVEAAHIGCVEGTSGRDGYVIAKGQGIRSVAALAVQPGDKLQVDTIVYSDTDPTNGEPLVFFTGLLIYDEAGQIISWWRAKPAIVRADGVLTVRDDIEVPNGAVSARIGVCGPWKPAGNVSNGRIGVQAAKLRKL